MSRKEKENLFIEKTIELQRLWQNPIPRRDEFNFSDATEDWLDTKLKETIDLIRYEKRTHFTANLIGIVVSAFVFLGVVGLLLFGIRQIFLLF